MWWREVGKGPIVENQTRTWNLRHVIRLSSTAARRMYRDEMVQIVENQMRTWNLRHVIRLSSSAARRMYRDEMVHKMTKIACAATSERCARTKSYSKMHRLIGR